MDDQTLRIVADPALPEQPTAGPWLITCSTCGPVGVAVTGLAADAALIEHGRLHRMDLMTGPVRGR